MKYPLSSYYKSGGDFVAALDEWTAAVARLQRSLDAKFRLSGSLDRLPEWFDKVSTRHVLVDLGKSRRVALSNLAGNILDGGLKVGRVAHGLNLFPDGASHAYIVEVLPEANGDQRAA